MKRAILAMLALVLIGAGSPPPKAPPARKPPVAKHQAAATVPAATAGAASASSMGAGFSFSDWQISTGQLDANWSTGAFTTPGHIVLTRPGSSIEADRANGNWKTHSAVLTGNVVLHDSNGVLTGFAGTGASHVPSVLTCDNLNIDGTTKTYTATGNVHFEQGGRKVSADRAIMNGATHEINLYGNVKLVQ